MCKNEGCPIKANNKKYGSYCSSHKSKYLLHDGLILHSRFTGRSSDYLKTDVINTLSFLSPTKGWGKVKKEYLFNTLKDYFEINIPSSSYENKVLKNIKYLEEENLEKIKNLQIKSRKNKDVKLRGIGYIDKSKCNNDTDFFTYDKIDEIEDKYFFSYKDNNSFIWFFDIRSFNRLIEMGQSNPYTRDDIPLDVIEKSKKLSKIMRLTDEDNLIDNQEIILTKRQILKQKTIDVFSQMEQYGFGCNIDWFLNLHARKLKNLYRSMEDIWNYRLNLAPEMKSSISPPNGIVFNIPVTQIMNNYNVESLQEIILNEVSKFNNAINEECKKLGYMYFLLGLGTVSAECYHSHQWLMHAING